MALVTFHRLADDCGFMKEEASERVEKVLDLKKERSLETGIMIALRIKSNPSLVG
jgi:hypothetical protein